MVLMWSRWLGSKQASPRLKLSSVVPEPPPGRPLIYTGDARRSIESQPVHTRISVGIFLFLTYNTSYTSGRFTATDSKPTIGLGPSSAYTTNEINLAQVGRFMPSGNIPNSRSRHGIPQRPLQRFLLRRRLLHHPGMPLFLSRAMTWNEGFSLTSSIQSGA